MGPMWLTITSKHSLWITDTLNVLNTYVYDRRSATIDSSSLGITATQESQENVEL